MSVYGLSGCNLGSHDPERYVLTGNDKNLFVHITISIDPNKEDEISSLVESFSQRHGMDFLSARKSLSSSDFNVSANGPSLNIKAMHTAAVEDTGVQVFAIVPKRPTNKDKALVKEFIMMLQNIQ
ncbi:hypothetical protein [Novosphingopyxis sp.]|uniref:hypothetical protein n=1 Tax=Novosphingopyxis sp. TaxID=2709690 RepID=UPI003B5A3F6B